jgi:hypothetical protein
MKRPRSHQIDELAQRVFRDALPAAWACNPHVTDYGKDYLVEIGEETADGEQTGNNFFVQLKGGRLSFEYRHAQINVSTPSRPIIRGTPQTILRVTIVKPRGEEATTAREG